MVTSMDAQNIDDTEYWMEDMTILPDIMTLDVRVIANEHGCFLSFVMECARMIFI